MRKFIFITIFILTFIFSSGVFVKAAPSNFSPDCKVVGVTAIQADDSIGIHIRVGMWSLNKKTCSPCWPGGRPAWNAFVMYHNDPTKHSNPVTVWWSWTEPSLVTERLHYHYPPCGWAAYNHYSEVLLVISVPSPPAIWPFCGETFDFKGDVYYTIRFEHFIGDQYFPAQYSHLASVSYTLTPRPFCEFRPSHSFVGGRGPGAKGSGAALESYGVGLGGGGLQGRGVTGYEIRYR